MTLFFDPLPATVVPAQSSGGAGLENVLTPHPREAFASADAAAVVTLDLGAARAVDSFFIGYSTCAEGAPFSVATSGGAVLWAGQVAHSFRRAPLRHALAVLPAPATLRYVRFTVGAAGSPPPIIGVVAAGLALRVGSGRDFGWGRPISDPSRVDRQLGGGFGIDRAVAAGGFSWTMPALSDEERERLYALQLDVGLGGTILVAEHADGGPGYNEALHWSLLTKLEPFDRNAPDASRWAMQVQDWA